MNGVRFLGAYDGRVAAELPEGFVVGTCEGECAIPKDAFIQGVLRCLGEQEWSDNSGHAMTVVVEDFDLDTIGLRNWSTGVE